MSIIELGKLRSFELKRSRLVLLIAFTISALGSSFGDSVLMKAMNDELQRSITKLQIEKQEKPYYISYRVTDIHTYEIEASFGGLLSSTNHRNRNIFVDLRIGSYNFDNSNFVGPTRGSRIIKSDQASLPLEDDYEALRHMLWLVTDGTYKKALEEFSRKRAMIQNRQLSDTIPDFSKTEPCNLIESPKGISLDQTFWQKNIVRLSKVFQKFPLILESKIDFYAGANNQYFLDTEGNRSQHGRLLGYIEIWAKTQAVDGDEIEASSGFYTTDPANFDISAIQKMVEAWAEGLSLQTRLKKEEGYSGPVLFTGQASAELFFQLLGKGVADPRSPLYEDETIQQNAKSENLGFLTGRLGKKVMPDFLSAYDDPNLVEWDSLPLVGHFAIDDQGVRSKRVDIVTEGRLTGLLMSRAPTKKISESNGHGRYRNENYGYRICGMPGILIIESKDPKKFEELIDQLVKLGKDYGTDYVLVITRLAPAKKLDERKRYRHYPSIPGTKPILSSPAMAYKIDVTTGKTELVRGLDFSSVTPRVLKDIVAAGKTDYVYNFVYRDDNGNEMPMSVIAPAVLIEEMDLVTQETEPTKPPILKHPCFTAIPQSGPRLRPHPYEDYLPQSTLPAHFQKPGLF